ncbi:MAG: hypothetical protein ACE5LU_22920 [Anaerolineae bacterium]
MESRRAEIMALCALILTAAAFTLMLRPILPATAGPLNQAARATPTSPIPHTFTYQGRLHRLDGNPYESGDTYSMTLRIYGTPVGGTAKYTETLKSVAVRDGWFTVVLGDKTLIAADVLYTAPLYLEVEVDGRRLLPRQRIHAVPQALLAAQALETSHAVQADEAAEADTAKALSEGATVDGLSSAVDINKAGDATADESFAHPVQIRGGKQSVQFGVDPARKVAYLQSTEDGGRTRDIVLNPRGGNVAIGPLEQELVRARATLDVNGKIRGKLRYTEEVRIGGAVKCGLSSVCAPDGTKGTNWSGKLVKTDNGDWFFEEHLGMAADKGFCFITHFSTTLGGGGENAAGTELIVRDGAWVLRRQAAYRINTIKGGMLITIAQPAGDGWAGARCAGIVD